MPFPTRIKCAVALYSIFSLLTLLQAASNGERETVRATIVEQRFADITALSSIANYLTRACEQFSHFGARRPDPQQSLF